jgi:hypothetical protein
VRAIAGLNLKSMLIECLGIRSIPCSAIEGDRSARCFEIIAETQALKPHGRMDEIGNL